MLVELVRSAHLFVSLLAVLCATHGTLSEADVARSEDAADLEFVAESHSHLFTEEDWGDGLRVLTTFMPESCDHRAKKDDIVHYHYVGRLEENGNIFGRSFDYDSPYIVGLGQGRIIQGMDRGLMGTCLLERRRITIPPQLGYGTRGVGQIIPPNSTLVFYIRLIKLERNGVSLGEDLSMEEVWDAGLASYTDGRWSACVDLMEETVRLFNLYEKHTLQCLRDCRNATDKYPLSETDQEAIEKFKMSSAEPFVEQFLLYATRSNCVSQCKAQALPPKLLSPDPHYLKDFRKRLPYTYLHYAYFMLGDYVEAAKCIFTFYFYNPNDELALHNIPFYRANLTLKTDEFISREPGVKPFQAAYMAGRVAYASESWLEAADYFEEALRLYTTAFEDCYLLCEDTVPLTLVRPDISPEKKQKLDSYGYPIDSMEYHQLLAEIVKQVLVCRAECPDQLARVKGSKIDNYFISHFNYLQYCYFKLGLFTKAAHNAATYIALQPSDETMAKNIYYYTSQYKIPAEEFVSRQEFVSLQQQLASEDQLLHLIENGEPRKKKGQRGDVAKARDEL